MIILLGTARPPWGVYFHDTFHRLQLPQQTGYEANGEAIDSAIEGVLVDGSGWREKHSSASTSAKGAPIKASINNSLFIFLYSIPFIWTYKNRLDQSAFASTAKGFNCG